MKTLVDLFWEIDARYQKPDLFWDRSGAKFQPISTASFRKRTLQLTGKFLDWGIKKGDRIALLSENRVEWTITDFAILTAAAVTVPLYATSTPEQIAHIIQDSQPKVVIVSGKEQLQKLVSLKGRLGSVEHVVSFDPVEPRAGAECVQDIWERDLGKDSENSSREVQRFLSSNDLASIIYTSGTTGEPKGVMLSHGNIVSNILATSGLLPMGPGDLALSVLPLSHIYERVVNFGYLYSGVSVAYCRNFQNALQDMGAIGPTIVACVPRLFEKIYSGLTEVAATGKWPASPITSWAIELGRVLAPKLAAKTKLTGWEKVRRALADHLVYSRVRKRLGGRIRFFLSGGAPLSRELAEFFYLMKLPILQGYGMTETSPIISATDPREIRFGSSGRPISGTDVRIAADGEILVRGPNLMLGYYNKPEATREVIEDGWLHTGDVGHLDAQGFLYITDRKKDLIVTSGGKKVAPQKIENLAASSRFVDQIIVVGNDRKFISAMIVPNFKVLEQYARYKEIPFQGTDDLVQNPQIKDLYLRQIQKYAPDLASFESVKKVILLPKPFTLAQGELTNSLKIRRSVVEKKYKSEIDALYRE